VPRTPAGFRDLLQRVAGLAVGRDVEQVNGVNHRHAPFEHYAHDATVRNRGTIFYLKMVPKGTSRCAASMRKRGCMAVTVPLERSPNDSFFALPCGAMVLFPAAAIRALRRGQWAEMFCDKVYKYLRLDWHVAAESVYYLHRHRHERYACQHTT